MSEPSPSIELTTDTEYHRLLGRISEVYTKGQARAHQAVNSCIKETYWQIGHDIVEYEQGGKFRADYGKALLANLSRDLKLCHGKGFSRRNLVYMRLFYLNYPISQKPSDLLSWSHYVELLKYARTARRSCRRRLYPYRFCVNFAANGRAHEAEDADSYDRDRPFSPKTHG